MFITLNIMEEQISSGYFMKYIGTYWDMFFLFFFSDDILFRDNDTMS